MRDLIERGGFVSSIHRAAVMDAHDDLVAGLGETAGGQNGVGRCTVHSGGREQPQRASQGFFATLTPEQQALALAYDGPEDFGPDEYLLAAAPSASQGGYIVGIPSSDGSTFEAALPSDAAWAVVKHAHGAVWDQALALAAEDGPMPLASAELWVEGDEAYLDRLGCDNFRRGEFVKVMHGAYSETDLISAYGKLRGIPRARLVPVEPCP
jgi:hypothetical protein